MWQILTIFGLYVAGVAAVIAAILNFKKIILAIKHAYWFAWGMYQQARYGGLPKQHYSLKNGQWQVSWSKRRCSQRQN